MSKFVSVDLGAPNSFELPGNTVFSNESAEGSSEPPPVMDFSVTAEIISMIRKAKDKHCQVIVTNGDRAVVFRDVNDIRGAISFNGIPLLKL